MATKWGGDRRPEYSESDATSPSLVVATPLECPCHLLLADHHQQVLYVGALSHTRLHCRLYTGPSISATDSQRNIRRLWHAAPTTRPIRHSVKPACQSVRLSVCLSACPYVYPPGRLSIRLSVSRLSVSQEANQSISMSIILLESLSDKL